MAYEGENEAHSEGLVVSYPVAASQTLEKGDFVKPNAAGTYVEACAATNGALGVLTQSMTTDASRNVLDAEGNIQYGVPAEAAVREFGMVWGKVDSTSELKIGDELELSAKDTLIIKTGGTAVAFAKEYKPASSTPTNGTGYLKVLLSPSYR